MVGKGKAAVAEKPSHIRKLAEHIIAWLQKGKPRRGGRKRSTCGHRATLIPVLEGTLSASQLWSGRSIALLCLGAQGRRLTETGSTSCRDLAQLRMLQLCGQGCLQGSCDQSTDLY